MINILYTAAVSIASILGFIGGLYFTGYDIVPVNVTLEQTIQEKEDGITHEECIFLSENAIGFDYRWGANKCWALLHRTKVARPADKIDLEGYQKRIRQEELYKQAVSEIIDL